MTAIAAPRTTHRHWQAPVILLSALLSIPSLADRVWFVALNPPDGALSRLFSLAIHAITAGTHSWILMALFPVPMLAAYISGFRDWDAKRRVFYTIPLLLPAAYCLAMIWLAWCIRSS